MSQTGERLVGWTEKRMPALARAVASPAVRGAVSRRTDLGEVFSARPATGRGSSASGRDAGGAAGAGVAGQGPTGSLVGTDTAVVYFTEVPASARWLAGSLAVRLGTTVLVPDAAADPVEIVAEFLRDGRISPTRVSVVGEGTGTVSALAICAATRVARLALLYPPALAVEESASIPTTLIQASRHGENRAATVALDAMLRRSGVAVRETEYETIRDGWARHPKVSSGSARALGDLVAFLQRGVGTQSTFEVIPGWDLH